MLVRPNHIFTLDLHFSGVITKCIKVLDSFLAVSIQPERNISLMLEAKSMSALIINPRFINDAHTDDLGCDKTSNRQQQMLIEDLNRIASKSNVKPRQILYCTTNSIPSIHSADKLLVFY